MNNKYHIIELLSRGLVISALISIPGQLISSATDSLFMSEKIILMELRSDFTAIQQEQKGTPVYHDGELTYRTRRSKPVSLPVRVMARGNFRLKPENCSFPPLLIDFKKGYTENTVFENQSKLKLVTSCQTEEDVIDEYTIYKMYNQVTDKSLKARLVKISYYDEDTNKKLFEKFSFFIEDDDKAASRNNGKIEKEKIMPGSLDRDNYLRLAIFQYMIGNLDWNVEMGKNVEILRMNGRQSGLYAIPYDFDFSAFVNAEYSKPRGVQEDILVERRRYLGGCFTEADFSEAFEFYREMKPVFETIIKYQKILAFEDRKAILDYVEGFYRIIGDSSLVKEEFLRACKTKGLAK